jgi:hypothetical protein
LNPRGLCYSAKRRDGAIVFSDLIGKARVLVVVCEKCWTALATLFFEPSPVSSLLIPASFWLN